jgi:N-sulfoglucosamine sulfohydrolase
MAKEDAQAAAVIARYRRRPAEELYDLHRDPLEQNNIAGDAASASVLNALRAQLEAWMQQQGDRGRATEDALEAP